MMPAGFDAVAHIERVAYAFLADSALNLFEQRGLQLV